jgi:hypothetical protein
MNRLSRRDTKPVEQFCPDGRSRPIRHLVYERLISGDAQPRRGLLSVILLDSVGVIEEQLRHSLSMRLMRLCDVEISPQDEVFSYSRGRALVLVLGVLGATAWLILRDQRELEARLLHLRSLFWPSLGRCVGSSQRGSGLRISSCE